MENMENTERRLTPEERQERIRKIKRIRKIRLAIVVGGFSLVLSLIIGTILFFTVFTVDKIDNDGKHGGIVIEGNGKSPYTAEQVIDASGIDKGDNIFFVDFDVAKANIEKKLPYLHNVTLSRKLPDQVIVRVEVTKKAYAIEVSKGTYALTDSNFKVLEVSGVYGESITPVVGATPKKAEIGETLSFSGNPENDATLNLIREISSAVKQSGLEKIDLVSIESKNNIYMIYEERVVLRLGDSNNLDKKISLGKKVIDEENGIDPDQTGVLNLTVVKKGYFNPTDYLDIPELMKFKPIEVETPAEEEPGEETTDEENPEEETSDPEEE